ncbi:hypothetical protein HBI22_252740 [Parastagonospora nodorum]|nr:hypothetical protein HBI28_252110 [Parastagonospora nodorum]KAH5617440.1 hypothetical protein HBI22_252740 [Parastagonospora nodorum]
MGSTKDYPTLSTLSSWADTTSLPSNSYSDYLWSTDTGAWELDWFTHVMQRETGTRLGCTLGLLEYRHAISTIGR